MESKKQRIEAEIFEYEYPSLKFIKEHKNINAAFGEASFKSKDISYERIYKSVKSNGSYICPNNRIYTYAGIKINKRSFNKIAIERNVIQLNLNSEIIAEYKNIRQASLATGITYSSINACIHKEQKTAGGFIWKRKSEILNDLL